MRRLLVFALVGLVVAGGVCLIFWPMLFGARQTYYGVQVGWTIQEIEQFFGSPPDHPPRPPLDYGWYNLSKYCDKMAVWEGQEDIIVGFDSTGRVNFAYRWGDDPETPPPKTALQFLREYLSK